MLKMKTLADFDVDDNIVGTLNYLSVVCIKRNFEEIYEEKA